MNKYLAFDAMNSDYAEVETLEEAHKWLEEGFYDSDEGYHPEMINCKVYKLIETVGYDVIDKKENYKYINEEDIPEDDNESEAYPYDSTFDEIWKHKFIPVEEQGISVEDLLKELRDIKENIEYTGFVFGSGILNSLIERIEKEGIKENSEKEKRNE